LNTFRLTLAYDGTAYAGWQVQPGVVTVQGVLEHAAERLNGEPASVLGAGRTDAGVHARGQVARFATARDLDAAQVPRALNAFLPEDVVVRRADAVGADFHPIRDARRKHYRYTLHVAPFDDPFDRRYVLRVPPPINAAAMRRAAPLLTGRHDFSSFEKAGSPRDSTVRTLHRLDLTQVGDYIHLDLVANGFLYGMARNLAGTLLRVGQGRLDPEAIPGKLDNREIAGPSLPARGLCLMRVAYDDTEERRT
jgi:tRNA pseudouridine38-40 synthase